MHVIRHSRIDVDGLGVFVRESGDRSRPTLVLLPGYPSSTRAYVRLIDRLAARWHVVAIDYPGFGSSDPLPGEPTFDELARVTGATIDALGISEYALYMFDFGAPVGFRIALDHDARVRAIITQNGNAYTDGFGPGVAALADWWADKDAGEAAVDWFVSLPGTQHQWQAGAREVEHIDPEQALSDQLVIDRPGRAAYMKALLWDYQHNPSRYPQWQAWLRRRQPALLAIWGANDPFFVPAGAEAYRNDVPGAEVILLDTGHFALEEELDEIASRIHTLMAATFEDPSTPQATPQFGRAEEAATIHYRTIAVDGLSIFYREAGPAHAPTILLLHGFPSSSTMFEPLFARLGNRYHLIAPDYPGFGYSDKPDPQTFEYTFDHLALVIQRFIGAVGLTDYSMYVQDYGGPIGFRLAVADPKRLQALIVQNAVAHEDGLGPLWEARRAFWADRAAHEAALRASFLSFETTKQRHVGSDPLTDRYNPDSWTAEYAFLQQPGQADIQTDLFYDYRTNVASYPAWQEWLRQQQPKTLVLWGKYDPSFEVAEATAFLRQVPHAEVHILDGGHFALDTAADEIAHRIDEFLSKTIESR